MHSVFKHASWWVTATLTLVAVAGLQPATADASGAVIEQGQEELLARMLGKQDTLPGNCVFSNGQITHTVVEATYACANGEVVIELHHPDSAPPNSRETAAFALSVARGEAPSALIDRLLENVRAGETEFHWTVIAPSPQPVGARFAGLAGAAVLLVVALVWILRRSARRTRAG